MNSRNDVQVIINNKHYTLCGYESDEYMQKVAAYINTKYGELRLQEGFNNLDSEMRNVLLAINLVDDYYKAKKQVDELEATNEQKDKEIFDMKHELIALQTQLESALAKLADSKENYDKLQKENIRLEVELEQLGKNNSQEKPEPKPQEESEEKGKNSGNSSSRQGENNRNRRK